VHQLHQNANTTGWQFRHANQPAGFDVLTRAKRAKRPGIVFARAAHHDATEHLTSDYSRLFIGLATEKK